MGRGTLADLIACLARTARPGLEDELMSEDGSLEYVFAVNGKTSRGLSTVIRDGDEIFVFPPMGGG